jgi:phage terminase small subunit
MIIENNKHKVFADEYILTNDPISSYQKAYPKAKSESARVESYKILQNPTIAQYIQESKDKIKNAREKNLIETLKAKDSSNILTREKFVEMTSNVVKLTYNKFIKSQNSDDADTYSRVSALLAKIEGFEAPKKIEQKTTLIGLDSEFID